MYTWKKLIDFTSWWTNESIAYPEKHIEDFSTTLWIDIDPKKPIQWQFPMESCYLWHNSSNIPKYIKTTDGKNHFYFYFSHMTETTGYADDSEFVYECQYILDRYMTYLHNFKHILSVENPRVHFIKKFLDRVNYKQAEKLAITLDIFNQKQFANILPHNYQFVKNYVYGTNAQKLWTDNYDTDPPVKITFTNYVTPTLTKDISYADLVETNRHGRYTYWVAKSSSLILNDTPDNTYIIIPVIPSQEANILQVLQNIKIDSTTNQINVNTPENSMSFSDCDLPPSMFYGTAGIKYQMAVNENFKDKPICFFRLPYGSAITKKIINYSDYEFGMDGKIKGIVDNLEIWTPSTEPLLLNPSYYSEKYVLDNDKYISSDLSLIAYAIPDVTIPSGMSLYASFIFDSEISCVYDYRQYNNKKNPFYNNNNSNLRADIGINRGVVGSSAANYYQNNRTTLYTANQNIKEQTRNSWTNYGFNRADDALSIASAATSNVLEGAITFGTTTAIRTGVAAARAGLNAGREAINLVYSEGARIRNYTSQIENIKSSPSVLVSNPFVLSYMKNESINGNSLFHMYAYELHDWDKQVEFTKLLNEGYNYNHVDKFNSYVNRQLMNVIMIDPSVNTELVIKILKEKDNTMFHASRYHYEFLAWLGSIKRFYNSENIVNVTDYLAEDYVSNIEVVLPNIPTDRINIKTVRCV